MTNPPSTAPDGATADSGVKVEALHTPGPWKVIGDGDRVIGADFNTVAAIRAPTNGCHTLEDDPVTEKANARLIAAAPELLEALRELADAFPSGGIVDGVKQKEDPALTGARAAIAKATGQ